MAFKDAPDFCHADAFYLPTALRFNDPVPGCLGKLKDDPTR